MVKLNLDYNDGFNMSVYSNLKKLDENIIKQLKTRKGFLELSKEIPNKVRYFLCKKTSNLLSLLDIQKEDDVLEINACIGEMTDVLCEKAGTVTSVEFSKRNAEIIKERLSDRDNLEIFVGNLSKMKFEKKFDYIFITDVLEFAAFFFKTQDPYKSFLEYCKSLLNPEGKIILMTFNRFGLKNWVGGYDEHTGNKFDGLEDYSKFSIKSFTKMDIKNLIESVDFEDYKFYYPMPSHFYTYAVLSDEYMNQDIVDYNFVKYSNGGFLFENPNIDVQNVLHKICAINEFEIFANSFFVIMSNEKIKDKAFYTTYINGVATTVVNEKSGKFIKKSAYNDIGKKYLSKMHKIGSAVNKSLEERGINNIKLIKLINKQKKDYYMYEYPIGTCLRYIYYEVMRSNNSASVGQFMMDYQNFINTLYSDTVVMDFSTEVMSDIFGNFKLKNVTCVKNSFYHLKLDNVYTDGENYTITDYGSICPYYLPVNYLVFAGLFPYFKERMLKKETLEILDISPEEMMTYMRMYSYHIQHPNIDFE